MSNDNRKPDGNRPQQPGQGQGQQRPGGDQRPGQGQQRPNDQQQQRPGQDNGMNKPGGKGGHNGKCGCG